MGIPVYVSRSNSSPFGADNQAFARTVSRGSGHISRVPQLELWSAAISLIHQPHDSSSMAADDGAAWRPSGRLRLWQVMPGLESCEENTPEFAERRA